MNEVLHMINEMSPFLLLGFLMAGVLHAFVPAKFYTRYLSRGDFRSVFYAAMMGVPLPLCSCGVLPTAMSLRKEGASKGATTSFLIATPQTGVDSIAATYSLMGLAFAVIRPVAALLTALFGGQLTNWMTRGEVQSTKYEVRSDEAEEHCCCHKEEPKAQEHCCCHKEADDDHCCCHKEDAEECGCHCGDSVPEDASFMDKVKEALRYAFIYMVGDIGKWLVIGLVIAALITMFVPAEFFAVFADNTLLSMLLVLAVSVPMYVCATGSIPIAVALMLKGLTPGAALVLLMAGPAANVASILVIRDRMGGKALTAYLLSIIGGAVACGLAIDWLLPREWFTTSLMQGADCCEPTTPFQWCCTALLAALLLWAAWRRYAPRPSNPRP